jgi:gliding motility-associated-like protein
MRYCAFFLSLFVGGTLICSSANEVRAQNFAANWALSFQTTLTFQGNAITTSNNASIVGYNATIISASNWNGDLLFFSSGHGLFHSGQALMPNGDSIFLQNQFGNIYLPALDDTNQYYVFVNGDPDNLNNLRLRSSSIDMSLNGGLGDVISATKNELLLTEVLGFGLSSTAHRDGQRAWLVVSPQNENVFKLLLIGNGVESMTSSPSYIGNDSTIIPIGYALRFSPNGKYLAFANSYDGQNTLMIYSFKNETGELTFLHRVSEADGASAASSMEFSSDSRYLYFTLNSSGSSSNAQLYQLELGEHWNANLVDSFTVWPRMQLDPARRILLGYQPQNIGAILNPNAPSDSLQITDSIASLAPQFLDSWFPAYISNWFNSSFCISNSCFGDTTSFYYAGYRMDSAIWNFGDPASLTSNIASGMEAKHVFTDTGWYQVTLLATTGSQTDTITQSVHISKRITHDLLANDTSLCMGDTVDLVLSENDWTILWSDSISGFDRSFVKNGMYFLTVENSCNKLEDSIEVDVDSLAPIIKVKDTSLCLAQQFELIIPQSEGVSFLWSTGDTSSSITLDTSLSPDLSPVKIWLIASNACGSDSDTMTLSFVPLPDAGLPPDSVQCFNAPVQVIRSDQDSTSYIWFDGSNDVVKLIEQDTSIWLVAMNICGSDTDSMRITFHPDIRVELGEDTFLCEGDSVVLDASWPGATYSWTSSPQTLSGNLSASSQVIYLESGSTSTPPGVTLQTEEEVNYVVTITEGPCTIVESRKISIQEEQCDSVACKFEIPNVFTPNGDGVNDLLRISNPCPEIPYRVSIYNRWGQLLYGGSQTFRQWDGFINGEPASSGTYFVVIEQDGVSAQRTSFTLLR